MDFFCQATPYQGTLKYHDPSCLPDDELCVEENTTALAVHLSDNEGEILNAFYKGVIQFYQRFIQKRLINLTSNPNYYIYLSFLDPIKSQGKKQCTVDQLGDILPVTFDKAAVKVEHHEFLVNSDIDCAESNAVKFWVNVYNMKSLMTRILPLLPSNYCLFLHLMQTVNKFSAMYEE